MKYKFNKRIFQVSLALTLILLGVMLINYGDYEEYTLKCDAWSCYYNQTFFENYTLVDHLFINEDFRIPFTMYASEYMRFSNYEKEPPLITFFSEICFIILILAFIINHFYNKSQTKKYNAIMRE